jgi:electron transfer flavoprotein alpha subunit
MSILVVAEHENSEIKAATLNTIAAGVAIGGDIHVLVAGQDCATAGKAASKIAGVAKVLVADSAEYANGIAENLSPLVLALADDYEHMLANSTSFGKNLMPRVAAMLDVQQISEA